MAMIIAWQTLNKVASPNDRRFTKRFLVVTPGITIRDRLRVLQPNDEHNYYRARGLVPADLDGLLGKAQILITNWHAFQLRDAKEIKGVSATTRRILLAGRTRDPFRETEDAMVSRVLRGWGVGTGGGRSGGEILVLNDEAHHCYQDKPLTADGEMGGPAGDGGAVQPDREAAERNKDARIWFTGLQAIARRVGIKQIYDLSATPFYLSGSGYKEGFIFPWTVSDFSLMDAIESGIVKVPRIPVDDDARAAGVTYLDLWERIGKDLPKRSRKDTDVTTWTPPAVLEGALFSLYDSYRRSFDHWAKELAPLGEPPPVFIVVCPNTAVSKLVYDWIAGTQINTAAGLVQVPGKLELFRNSESGAALPRPRTILVDSAQLESGEGLKADFKKDAAAEIEAFKAAWRLRNPGGDADSLTDEDLLREVMNTVGKPDSLGSDVRCVVSVAMLTEGWDANTVTHILGIRAFGSQLLCEQVVGRGLRRRIYVTDDTGRFPAEYANVYGVPFRFIPTDRPVLDPKPQPPATEVRSIPGRETLRIRFPLLSGYRLEIPDAELFLPDDLPEFRIGPDTVPTWTQAAPIAGTAELIKDDPVALRPRSVAYRLARRLVRREFAYGADVPAGMPGGDGDPGGPTGDGSVPAGMAGGDGDPGSPSAEEPAREEQRPWLFPTLVRLCAQWIEGAVRVAPGFHLGYLSKYALWEAQAADAIYRAITSQHGNRQARILPILRQHEPVGSTGNISFATRKVALRTAQDRCEISHVVLDGPGGNTWEQLAMEFCEHDTRVAAYAKNDHVGFSIPYVFEGRSHEYVPDFLLRLRKRDPGDPAEPVRTLIVEVSGGQKRKHSPGSTAMKAAVARDSWCPAVNNHGAFGRWGYVEITDPPKIKDDLSEAIENLYADRAIIGPPDLLDLADRTEPFDTTWGISDATAR